MSVNSRGNVMQKKNKEQDRVQRGALRKCGYCAVTKTGVRWPLHCFTFCHKSEQATMGGRHACHSKADIVCTSAYSTQSWGQSKLTVLSQCMSQQNQWLHFHNVIFDIYKATGSTPSRGSSTPRGGRDACGPWLRYTTDWKRLQERTLFLTAQALPWTFYCESANRLTWVPLLRLDTTQRHISNSIRKGHT